MTKLEAIAILDGFKYNPLLNEQHFEALDMAVSALSENKGDLISRQAVLDELEKWDWQDLYLPSHFKQILDDVPSTENKGEWIPVTERLPENLDSVLATTKWGELTIAEKLDIGPDCWFIYEGNANAHTEDIVAWQPLPEPYKEGGE